jgi:bisphosphoglycerate-dependent phosphoglycerate mutase
MVTHSVATVTGWKDPALTEQGKGEALKGAQELKKYGYVSMRCTSVQK